MPRPKQIAGIEFEREAWNQGYRFVAGLDEVGRGALAGPVVAAAVVFDPSRIPEGLADSKTLPRSRREALSESIFRSAIGVSIAMVDAAEIDATNILRATLAAMSRAVEALPVASDYLLVDGNTRIPAWPGQQRTLVGGDAASASIAAASIVAKVERDRLLASYDELWPGYGFAAHVGYGTAAHLAAIARIGPCPIHRRTFRGVLTTSLFTEIG